MPAHSYEFHLFRITVHPAREPILAAQARLEDKPALLRQAVLERSERRWGRSRWKIGNVADVGDGALYFRIWRSGRMTVAQPDDRGNIIENEVAAAPNTHVLLDARNQVCAIAKAPKLAAEPSRIARGLARLLTSTAAVRDRFVEIQATPIKDPQDFVHQIRTAHRVQLLWVEERRPNPFDVTGLARSLSHTVESLKAEKVKAQWTGSNLDASGPVLEQLIRATGIAGGNAGARIQETPRSRGTIAISLESRHAKVRFEADFDAERGRRGLLSVVYDMFRSLRPPE